MDPNNNQNSPVRPNYTWNLPEIPAYFPQPPQNSQMPPPQYSQNYCQFSPNFSHPAQNFNPWNQAPGFGSSTAFNPYMMHPPNYFPGGIDMPAYGSPAQQRSSQERPASGRDSASLPEDDDDVVPVVVPVVQPQAQEDYGSASRKPWNDREDEALISSFLEYSIDPITGTNQRNPAFWGKIEKRFNAIQQEQPRLMSKRNQEMIRGRWRRLSRAIAKWVGCYEQADRRRKSGMREEDVINEALSIFASDNNNSKFTFIGHGRSLRNCRGGRIFFRAVKYISRSLPWKQLVVEKDPDCLMILI